jgi:DNA-binding XRE family transcriptional regulator
MTGTSIKRLRNRLGASHAEMAALLGTVQATIYRWEQSRGELPPIGLAQRQLLLLIGSPSKADAARLVGALRAGGVFAAWAYLTKPYNLMPTRTPREPSTRGDGVWPLREKRVTKTKLNMRETG